MINDNNKGMIIVLEKALPSKTPRMTGTSLSADELKRMDMVVFSPSIILTALSKRLIVTPENP
ncbi:MAG: hypothetical protein MJE68_11860 [Proteobacteria bacterium]|nr:hypothetical protein [Pseudomonadota bacterium]